MNSKENDFIILDNIDNKANKADEDLLKKEYKQYHHNNIDKSVNKIVHFSLWIVYIFILLLVIAFFSLAYRLIIVRENRIFFAFQIISSFLAGSIGAGFGDKIFGGLRVFWNRWIERQNPSSKS